MPDNSAAANLQDAFELEEQAEDLLDEGRFEEAAAAAEGALAIDAKSISAWLSRGAALKALGRYWDAADALERALALMPGLAIVHLNVANIYAALERFAKAEDHLRQAIAIEPSLTEAYANLGSVYIRMVRYDLAEAPTRHALSLDAGNVVANQNLAAILAQKGAPEAHIYRDAAFNQEQIFVEAAQVAGAPVALVLSGVGSGNVPHQHLLPRAKYGRVFWFVEYAPAGQEDQLPAHDFIFNAVGDPDAAPDAQAAAEKFARVAKLPLINSPLRVAQTYRSSMPGLLSHIEGAVVPGAKRFTAANGDIKDAILASGLRFPLIVRPAGRHGGEGAARVDAPEELAARMPSCDTIYATEFYDYRSPDGHYRKYRVIFVDRKPYPYHMAVGDHWLVHYWTSGMDRDESRRKEEQAFLKDPETVVGKKAWAALWAIAAELDLDYAGIDFGLLADGRLLFFEANATMLVHPDDEAIYQYREQSVRAILAAVDMMIADRIRRGRALEPSQA
jgi:tetratricopeptide (TPR) repeat protein